MLESDFQREVARFVDKNKLEISVSDRMLDLVSEIGELPKEILKSSDYGKKPFLSDSTWVDELGDVFFSLICVANSTNVNLYDGLMGAMEKYGQRMSKKGVIGSIGL